MKGIFMKTGQIKFEDEELLRVIYKTLEIFKTVKDTKLKLYNKVLSIEDKKILSILLGVLDTSNRVGDRLNKYGFSYGIIVRTSEMKDEEYNDIYNNYFDDMNIEENIKLEDFLGSLVCNPFFIELNKNAGLSSTKFREVLEASKNKEKTLQKRSNVVL